MKHKVKLTVIDKKLYPELQRQYCADPNAGSCPCYNVGDEFIFYRNDERDDFWHMGLNTLVKQPRTPILLRADRSSPTARNCGTQSPVTYTRDFRAVL